MKEVRINSIYMEPCRLSFYDGCVCLLQYYHIYLYPLLNSHNSIVERQKLQLYSQTLIGLARRNIVMNHIFPMKKH